MISAGTPPLRTLRYHLGKGDRTASELIWDFATQNDGKADVMPSLVLDLETTVDDVRADGSARLRIRVVKSNVRGGAAGSGSAASSDLARSEAVALQGVTIGETLAPDGAVSDVKIDAPPGLPAAVTARLEALGRGLSQAAMRLPSAPVGATASWRERKTLPEGGIRAVSEATYTLSALTDTTVTYEAQATSSGPAQTIEQDGVKVEITDTHGQAETRGTVDLAHYAPQVHARSSFATTMNVAAPADAPGAGKSTIAITMALELAPTALAASPPDKDSDKEPDKN
ncbi:MAG TPA: hypothetical protein VFP84_33610 [Kofleriaceae bacterium]|nr:hypothetical protein [Kofleriaceae bacterium]